MDNSIIHDSTFSFTWSTQLLEILKRTIRVLLDSKATPILIPYMKLIEHVALTIIAFRLHEILFSTSHLSKIY